MAKKDSFNADYEALFRDEDPGLFDDKEYELKKKLGQLGSDPTGEIDVNEMLAALEGLESEKSRLKDKRWYEDTESPELKKAKYGDIPEQFADIGSDKELRGEQSDIESIFEKPSEDDLPEEESEETPKGVSVEKTKVTKAPIKSSMPNVLVGRDTSLEAVRKELERKKKAEKPKEKVKLSADTFEPEEVELEPGKDDESWKSMLKSLGTPDKGVEEDEVPWMLGGLGGVAKGLGRAAVKGFGKSASEGIGKSLVSEAGEAAASKVPPVPSASRMLADKLRLASKEADSLTDSIREPMKKTGEVMKRRMDIATKKYPSVLKPVKGGAKLSPSHEAQIRERARSLFEQLKSGKISQSEFAKQLRLLENIVK